MNCKKCGCFNDINNSYCNICGKKLKSNKKQALILILLSVIVVLLLIVAIIVSKEKDSINTRTVMIYMVGSNLESIGGIATADIKSIDSNKVDLENVTVYLYTGGTQRWFNFVSNNENAIYKLTKDGFKKEKSYEKKNMGDPNTLKELLEYGYQNSKTNKYDLIVYDHGGATDGAIYDDFTKDNLTLKDFSEALKNSPFNSKNKLETVLFRTCLNGTLEVGNIFKDYAEYMVASEEVTNGANTSSVLNFLNEVKVEDNAIEYGKKFISAYESQMKTLDPYNFSTDPMYSIWDLSKLDTLNSEFDKFIEGVNLKNNYSDIVRVRSNLFQFAKDYHNISDYDTVDLYSLVDNLTPYSTVKPDKLINAFNDVIVYNWSVLDNAKGMSVYFPYNAALNKQNYLMKVYDDLNFSNNYKNFISDFKEMYTSNKKTAYTSEIVNNETKVTDKKEFTLKLSNAEVKDYAESIYIIFKKEEDGKFTLVYSSNNTTLKGNTLKTNISNNLIKVKKSKDLDAFYLPIVERNADGKRILSFIGTLESYNNGNYIMEGARWYLDYNKKGEPYIVNVMLIDKEGGVGGTIADLNKYTTYGVIVSHYNILDEKGNYIPNWSNGGVVSGYNLKPEEFKMEKASLDNSDYYCVFGITDIYGKSHYSKLISIKEK